MAESVSSPEKSQEALMAPIRPFGVPKEKQAVKILVVNDHLVLREGLVALLGKFGDVEVVGETSTLEETINMLRTTKPHVVLADLAIESEDPFELMRKIKSSFSVKILCLVGKASDTNLSRGLESGADGFISRYESVKGIASAINKVCTDKIFFSQDLKNRLVARQSIDQLGEALHLRRNLLSPREVEVLCCVAKGLKAKSIGKSLHITAKTVERHKSNIMAKLGLHSQVDLAIYAIKEGYITP